MNLFGPPLGLWGLQDTVDAILTIYTVKIIFQMEGGS